MYDKDTQFTNPINSYKEDPVGRVGEDLLLKEVTA